jgi:hypothetical protein
MFFVHFNDTQIAISLAIEVNHAFSYHVLLDKVVNDEFGGRD